MNKFESGQRELDGVSWQKIGIKKTESGKWVVAPGEPGELGLEAAKPQDWQKLSEISVIASPFEDMKRDPESPTAKYFSEFWIGQYREHEPGSALVIRDNITREPVGYLVGAKDTRQFEEDAEKGHLRTLRASAMRGDYGTQEENRWHRLHTRAENEGKKLEGIKNMFGQGVWDEVYERYPAHLHMNFVPEKQKGGLGGIIINEFLERLKSKNVPGIHLGCDDRAHGFYKKMGFEVFEEKELSTRPDGSRVITYIMVKDLAS